MTLTANTAQTDHMLKLAGEPASFGTVSTYGLLEREAVPAITQDGEFGMSVYRHVLRIRPGTLGAIRTGSLITISGVRYKVRNIGELEDDGLLPVTVGKV